MSFPPTINLSGRCFPEEIIEDGIGHVIVTAAHFDVWYCECVRVRSCSRPWHRECSEIRYPHCFSNVYSGHGTRTFNQYVGILAGSIRRDEKSVKPATEFGGGFLEEGDGEHAVFNTDAHEFCRVSFNGGKFDTMTFDPVAVFGVRCDFAAVS